MTYEEFEEQQEAFYPYRVCFRDCDGAKGFYERKTLAGAKSTLRSMENNQGDYIRPYIEKM